MQGLYVLCAILVVMAMYYYYLYHHCKKMYFQKLLTNEVEQGEVKQVEKTTGGVGDMMPMVQTDARGGMQQAMIESYDVMA